MTTLLIDLATEALASNLRTADRLDAEARELDQKRQASPPQNELRNGAVAAARQATDQVISRLPQAEGIWRQTLTALLDNPTESDAEQALRTLLTVADSGHRLVQSARSLWTIARLLGASADSSVELDMAENRLKEFADDAKTALNHRTTSWQPADPTRLALGLCLAREGKTVSAEAAGLRFRRTVSVPAQSAHPSG